MLSICIPVYHFHAQALVSALSAQLEQLDIPGEILLFDDASTEFVQENLALNSLPHVTVRHLDTNVGRAQIRNLLGNTAQYDWLVFIDGDALVQDDQFLQRYLDHAPGHPVMVGGTAYQEEAPRPDWNLRWWYGRNREQVPAALRNQHPNRSFTTFNFLIHRSIFQRFPFESSIQGYGHEDTLMGLKLAQAGIPVFHLDNALIHDGLEPTDRFLDKTRVGVRNLMRLYRETEWSDALGEDVKLLRYFRKLERLRLQGVGRVVFRLFRNPLERTLHRQNPNLLWMDLYKLGLCCES
ncbi:glycosyltransferase [Pontibacter sp. G13]|uniref:glycosyltransferase family 2 protein n=1 Tax=Pontibacter sp. G13 TaxID=3074898 RepID=UPI0028893267|nr:glycosyltransferase [Pontibacter sp. G13]WNJ17490.1 glycosyltransferase [Pontibacter sp. G13]